MIAHPEYAKQYSALKQKLVELHPNNIEEYMDGKEPFIKEVDKLAKQWNLSLDQ